MKWEQVNKYYMKSVVGDLSFSISKSKVYNNVIYELWKLPYNKAEFIFRSENLEDVKREAVQYYKEQSTSPSSQAK